MLLIPANHKINLDSYGAKVDQVKKKERNPRDRTIMYTKKKGKRGLARCNPVDLHQAKSFYDRIWRGATHCFKRKKCSPRTKTKSIAVL